MITNLQCVTEDSDRSVVLFNTNPKYKGHKKSQIILTLLTKEVLDIASTVPQPYHGTS